MAVLLAAVWAQLWLGSNVGASPCDHRTGTCAPLHVPRDFGTIQEAIDAAPDDATILVAAGVYDAPIRIERKRLRIIGSDDGRTEIASFSREMPLVTYGDDGGGELKNVVIRGGSCGVCAVRDGSSMPSALTLKDVTVTGGYRGIFGEFSSLEVKHVDVAGARWHGISITHVGVKLTLADVEVHDVGGVGLLVLNGGPGEVLIGGHFHHNAKGGVEIVGKNGVVNLLFVVADYNHDFGILLSNASAGIALSSAAHNGHITADGGCNGAGLWAANSSATTVTGTAFAANCIGIYNDGSSVAFGSDTFDSNAVALGHEPGAPFAWTDFGNNVCGDNLGTAGQTLFACQDLSLDLEPPDPLAP